jgi:organic hydroperoxide reductase OsmC/OhrA
VKIGARIRSGAGRHVAEVETTGVRKAVSIPAKQDAPGSSINGGELLLLAIATCYCNDVYREAGKRSIAIESVEVDVVGEFGGEGEGAHHVQYSARVAGAASEAELKELLVLTDRVAEIHNTLRSGVDVRLERTEVVRVNRAAEQ